MHPLLYHYTIEHALLYHLHAKKHLTRWFNELTGSVRLVDHRLNYPSPRVYKPKTNSNKHSWDKFQDHACRNCNSFIHIEQLYSASSGNYSKALPTPARLKRAVFIVSRNCKF